MVLLMPFVFLICHIGENVSTAYEKVHGATYNISWHLWPVEMQKFMSPMLLIAEQPVYFQSIIAMNCSHESFQKVKISVHLIFD